MPSHLGQPFHTTWLVIGYSSWPVPASLRRRPAALGVRVGRRRGLAGEPWVPPALDELVQKVSLHVADAHPELVGKMSRDDILAMAEET